MMETITRDVILTGLRPFLFDRYTGTNETVPTVEKLYVDAKGLLTFPMPNLYSFLASTEGQSCAKLFGGKAYKKLALALQAFVCFDPYEIPFLRDGKRLKATDTQEFYSVGRPKGIPHPQRRPLLPLPWSVAFTATVTKNEFFDEKRLRELFEKGGLLVSIGGWRQIYGKFAVTEWK